MKFMKHGVITNSVVVKKVEGKEIYLHALYHGTQNDIPAMIVGFLSVFVAMGFAAITSFYVRTPPAADLIFPFFCVILGVGGVLSFYMTRLERRTMYAVGAYGCDYIFINKAGDASDQVDICKAVQQIEAKLVASMEEARAEKARLQEIAGRCK